MTRFESVWLVVALLVGFLLRVVYAWFYPQLVYYVVFWLLSLVLAFERLSSMAYAVSGFIQALASLTNSTLLPFGLLGAPVGIWWLPPEVYSWLSMGWGLFGGLLAHRELL